MKYIETLIITNPESADLLCTLLEPFAEDQSVIQERIGDPKDLNPTALLPNVAVKFWFEEMKDSEAFRADINAKAAKIKCGPATFTLLDSIDWTTEWRKNYRPLLAGKSFIIVPPWEENPDPERTPILIDPGIAFGTGQHETTQLCITQLEKHVAPGMRILDLGSGSAILSMAAKHLGASHIAAVEVDADAVRSAAENLNLNGISDTIELHTGSLETVAGLQWDLIVANILAVILIQLITEEGLLEIIKPGGRIIFSGILQQQLEDFEHAIDPKVAIIEEVNQDGDWVSVTVCRLSS
ncbi:MAG: 50S ribosomal protein L11 methyltransferase [Anaerolineae bacterium]